MLYALHDGGNLMTVNVEDVSPILNAQKIEYIIRNSCRRNAEYSSMPRYTLPSRLT
jgi:hypothetical protein